MALNKGVNILVVSKTLLSRKVFNIRSVPGMEFIDFFPSAVFNCSLSLADICANIIAKKLGINNIKIKIKRNILILTFVPETSK